MIQRVGSAVIPSWYISLSAVVLVAQLEELEHDKNPVLKHKEQWKHNALHRIKIPQWTEIYLTNDYRTDLSARQQ